MKLILLKIAALTLIMSACTQESTENKTEVLSANDSAKKVQVKDSIIYDLEYQGTLPCKDCGGVKTTLQLSTHHNVFFQLEEYPKTGVSPYRTKGTFNTERGFEKDPDATLYILDDTVHAGNRLFFVRETGKDSILTKLDGERHRTNHSNYFLKKMR